MKNLKSGQRITGPCRLRQKVNCLVWLILVMVGCTTRSAEVGYTEEARAVLYVTDDLGMHYSPAKTTFRMWSPDADSVRLNLYASGHLDDHIRTYVMQEGEGGSWYLGLDGDHEGRYYTYQIFFNGQWLEEKPDLYAVSTGVNGERAMILDLDSTDPPGWENDERPPLEHPTDMIIYEMHIRDFSIDPSSGIHNKGKYTGVAETGTRSPQGLTTGIDHLREMGITHVHLLPAFDYRSIDETRLDSPQFNWGYDPVNYNVPEGSYSTDPYDGRVRVREFKQMVQALHKSGIRVIMDVVYNHTGQTMESGFSQLVPDYFYRMREDGTFSDASACGNETASEKAMMRKFMIESVKYWVDEYHVDGFRFDLMGIHDIETMNLLSETLYAMDTTLVVYGEGWTAGESPLPQEKQALKKNTWQMPLVAAFSDDIRDGLKGSVFDHADRGFASGKPGMTESVKFGVVASTRHPQVNCEKVNYSTEPWAAEPRQTINYVSCHDNHTLYDKLRISVPEAADEEISAMHRLANTIVLTSQGIPFLHAGVEFMRTKNGVENSYNSPDSINRLNWSRKSELAGHVSYYQNLIRLRREHPAFRMHSADMIRQAVTFRESEDPHLLSYVIDGTVSGDSFDTILVVANGENLSKKISLPEGDWRQILDGERIVHEGENLTSTVVEVKPYSALILAILK